MGQRGPKGTATEFKVIEGNPGKLAKAKLANAFKIEPNIPNPPPHLDTGARREWNRITKELSKYGLMSDLDMAAVAGYCENFSRWARAGKEIKRLDREERLLLRENPDLTVRGGMISVNIETLVEKKNVWLQISLDCHRLMLRYISEFGLSPAARTKLQLQKTGDSDGGKEEDPKSKKRFFS